MKTKIIEATNNRNYGKFLVGRFDSEWERKAAVGDPGNRYILLAQEGWGREHFLVLDLATGEGAIFKHGGFASADLDKHKVWVCPLFEPFLQWLYKQKLEDMPEGLPDVVEIALDMPLQFSGYRRKGGPTR